MSPDDRSTRETRDRRDPEEIREDAAETRRRVSEDLDELGERLSTEGMKREARSAIDSAEEIAVDAARNVADRAARRVEDAGDHLAERLERFPVPLALIGLGLGWVLMRARHDDERTDDTTRAARSRDRGTDRGVIVDDDGYGYPAEDAGGAGGFEERDGGAYARSDRDVIVDDDGYGYPAEDVGSGRRAYGYRRYDSGYGSAHEDDDDTNAWIAGAIALGTGLLVTGVAGALLNRDDDEREWRRRGRGRVRSGVIVGAGPETAAPRPRVTSRRYDSSDHGSSSYDSSSYRSRDYDFSDHGSRGYGFRDDAGYDAGGAGRSGYGDTGRDRYGAERGGAERSWSRGNARGGSAGRSAIFSSSGYAFDDDLDHFRSAHRERYGDDAPFEDYRNAYRFGTRLGAADRLSDRHWEEIEEGVRQRWQARGHRDWETHREAVRYGFERVRVRQDPGEDPERLPD